MPPFETAAMIAEHRHCSAIALLEGRADLRGYPYRYLGVLGNRGDALGVHQVLSAAEMLHQYGWELINVGTFAQDHLVFGFLRRVSPGP